MKPENWSNEEELLLLLNFTETDSGFSPSRQARSDTTQVI